MSERRDEILAKLKRSLDRARYQHSLRVEKIALALGKKFGISRNKISLAALLHDCARRYDRPGLLRWAKKIGLKIDPIRRLEPKLFHAEISAWLAKKEYGVRSAEVLRAIRHHTVGAVKMGKLEKVIYLADHIEEGRRFSGVKRLRRLAFRDLDKAVAESTSNLLLYLLKKNLPIYPGTVATRNQFVFRGKNES